MGVKLDWQIETERDSQRAGEDPEARRRRREQRFTILIFTVIVVAIIGGLAAAIALRLNTVDDRLNQTLVDAVHAETTALRIGDMPAFMALMRSASSDWTNEQRARFKRYQDLKTQSAIQFTDKVDDTAVDGQRGRAVVEEVVNGQPYQAVWFYWRYIPDGWRHVPADLTFWGDPQQFTTGTTTVKYSTLDRSLAHTVGAQVDRWWSQGCTLVGCGTSVPSVTVEIVPDPSLTPQWSDNSTTLRIASPLAAGDRALVNAPLSVDLQEAIASRLADKLFETASGQLPINGNTDAAWLHQSIVEWVTASLLGHGDLTRIGFMQSLVDHYGGAKVIALLVHQLSTNSDINLVATAVQQPLETLNVDWRTFFQWRLELEKDLITSNNQAEFQALWDPSSVSVQGLQRWTNRTQALPQVQSVKVINDPTKGVIANVSALLNNQTVTITFRVSGGSWKRLS